MKSPFYPADILTPKTDLYKWSVIACDQFTSSHEYWDAVKHIVGDAPSSLNLILPELYLSEAETRISRIHAKMTEYLQNGVFEENRNCFVYVERTLPSGKIRHGVVGMIDLDEYPNGLIRPTEQTVPDRVPPRARIRMGAPLELPHVLLFTGRKDAIPTKSDGKLLYDTTLMCGGGSIKGFLFTESEKKAFVSSLESTNGNFCLAVGDGNHSIAAAKAAGSRYMLTEIVSIYDEAIVFEPIYRAVFGANAGKLLSYLPKTGKHPIKATYGDKTEIFGTDGLPVAAVDSAINKYEEENGEITIDYIHGRDELARLAKESGVLVFEFDGIDKSELFPYIEKNGCLPKKAFSMGTAYEKRYYIEAMKIIAK